MLAQRRP